MLSSLLSSINHTQERKCEMKLFVKGVMAALFSLMLVASVATAQNATSADTQPQPVISQQDADAIRANAQQLGRLFGVEEAPKPAAQVQENTTPEPKKTIANVADKAIDMMGQAVATIATNLQKVAPEVWRIMIMQQYVKAIKGIVVPWGLFVTCMIYMFAMTKRVWLPSEKESEEEKVWRAICTKAAPIISALCFAVWGLVRLADSIGYLINPEFYAIQDLLRMILNPGMPTGS